MRTLNINEMEAVSGAGNYADKHGAGSGNNRGGERVMGVQAIKIKL